MALFIISCEGILNLDLIGDGKIESHIRSTSYFHSIELTDNFILEIVKGESREITIEGESNLLPYVLTEVERSKLIIRRKDNFNLISRKPIKIQVTTPSVFTLNNIGKGTIKLDTLDISKLTVNNINGSIIVAKDLNIEELVITSEGGATSEIHGTFSSVSLRQIGSGNCFVFGESETINLIQEGSGIIDALNLSVKNADLFLFGSGVIYCHITDTINVTAKGVGRIYFKGDPVINNNSDQNNLFRFND